MVTHFPMKNRRNFPYRHLLEDLPNAGLTCQSRHWSNSKRGKYRNGRSRSVAMKQSWRGISLHDVLHEDTMSCKWRWQSHTGQG